MTAMTAAKLLAALALALRPQRRQTALAPEPPAEPERVSPWRRTHHPPRRPPPA